MTRSLEREEPTATPGSGLLEKHRQEPPQPRCIDTIARIDEAAEDAPSTDGAAWPFTDDDESIAADALNMLSSFEVLDVDEATLAHAVDLQCLYSGWSVSQVRYATRFGRFWCAGAVTFLVMLNRWFSQMAAPPGIGRELPYPQQDQDSARQGELTRLAIHAAQFTIHDAIGGEEITDDPAPYLAALRFLDRMACAGHAIDLDEYATLNGQYLAAALDRRSTLNALIAAFCVELDPECPGPLRNAEDWQPGRRFQLALNAAGYVVVDAIGTDQARAA